MCHTLAVPQLAPTPTIAGVAGGGPMPTMDAVVAQLAAVTNQLQGVVNALAAKLAPPIGGGPGAGAMGCPCNPVGQGVKGAATTIGALPSAGADPGITAPAVPPPPSSPPPMPAAQGDLPGPLPGAASASNVDVGKWVEGDIEGLNQDLLNRLAKVGEKLGKKLNIKSGFRSREEQEVLYQKYLNGTGNLAAKPGSSKHETGNAADVNVGGTSLANVPGAKDIAAELGLGFPVPGEPWHVEIV